MLGCFIALWENASNVPELNEFKETAVQCSGGTCADDIEIFPLWSCQLQQCYNNSWVSVGQNSRSINYEILS